MTFRFSLHGIDASTGGRWGTLETPHGPVETPGFMPVGTQGTVKGLTIDQVAQTGAQMILGNTYHLGLRPGPDTVQALGGLHAMFAWEGPILTDSGGFQVFSLKDIRKITEHSVVFRSHIDGAIVDLTPEYSIEIQEALGSDIAMVLDHVVALPADDDEVELAMERSIRWAARCLEHASRADQAKFAIVQGGLNAMLRTQCARDLATMDFEGFAVGGLSVGEAPEEMYRITEITTPELPVDKPRYLMGVGRPIDLLESVARGIDLFDCVMPTRNGRNGFAFTESGPIKIRNAKHRSDKAPLDPTCDCLTCARHSRGYLRHLFIAGEMLGPILMSLHNLTYYQRVMRGARRAIQNGTLSEYIATKKRAWAIP